MGDHRKLRAYKKKTKISRPLDGTDRGSLRRSSHRQDDLPDGATGVNVAATTTDSAGGGGVGGGGDSAAAMGRKTTSKKATPSKERWLLTRKTWKYMQQAGRRLIPDGTQNRVEDLPRIEEYFQHVCRTEQKFIIWSRKSSFPGAFSASRKLKRRLRPSLRARGGQKSNSADEAEIDEFKENDRRAAMVIRLLHSYLNIAAEQDKRSGSQANLSQTTTTAAATAGAAAAAVHSRSGGGAASSTATGPTTTTTKTYSSVSVSGPQRFGMIGASESESELTRKTNELLDSLRLYSQAAHKPIIPPEHITTDLLHNKTLLKKIYNDLKRQQLSLVLNRHTAASTNSLSHASSLTSLFHFGRDKSNKSSPTNSLNIKLRSTGSGTTTPTGSAAGTDHTKDTGSADRGFQLLKEKYIRPTNQLVPFISASKPVKTYTSQGMQTDFLQLHRINDMRKEYEARKKELDAMNQSAEDDSDVTSRGHSRRKSSVDNEDVSQSVSDTIKRYLRMARKKSVNDDAANRFKRVNYDRNLRNIRAKGEINPPGMDEGNSKATQTLDAWPLLHYNNIRGIDSDVLLEEAHSDWNNALQQRKLQYEEYLQQQQQRQQQQQQKEIDATGAPGSASAGRGHLFSSGGAATAGLHHTVGQAAGPAVGTNSSSSGGGGAGGGAAGGSGLFHSAQQQQQQQQQHASATTGASPGGGMAGGVGGGGSQATAAMQKSKSSSNVGQFVSKRIWKSRSKSQSRISTKPQWSPQGNCIWMSPSGKRVSLTDTRLHGLTEIERKILHRVAIEKINQLNIGVNVTAPGDISSSGSGKSQKRRPLLIKRKALTTSIFDTSKKDESKVNGGSGGLVFGVSIEKCVDNDRVQKMGGSVGGGGSERGSRNSIISLLGVGGGSHHSKGSDHIGSCESLPSRSTNILGQYDDGGGGGGGGVGGGGVGSGSGNSINSSGMKISRSQTDIRRGSQDDDDLSGHDAPSMVNADENSGQHVPALVLECIKHLEEHGMHTVGIFRVSTSKKRVRQLKEDFDRGQMTTIDPDVCPHDVATILKEYLRDLPEPLLCRNLYKAFVKIQKIRNRRLHLEALSHLLQLLPVAHRDTLYVLLRFLAKVVRSSDDVHQNENVIAGNKMDSNNLATVIAPNILRPSETGRSNTTEQEIDEQIDVINVIRTMIDHYEELFRVPAELMDEIYTNMMDTYPEQLDYLCERRDTSERYEDDMDSGSSSTPLHSPPPIGVLKPQQISQFAQHSSPALSIFDDSSGGGGGGIFGTGGSTNDRNSSSRPIYSRDDFLHENTIKGGGDPNGTIAPQRRERTSKMKYIEGEQDVTRRRRRDRNASDSGGGSGSGETSQATSPTKSPPTTAWMPATANPAGSNSGSQSNHPPPRRLFPPYGDSGGVVTASLKIPVQMQQQSQRLANMCDTTTSGGQIDLSDIPYIEDNGCAQDVLTGSLQFRRASSKAAYQIPITIEGRTSSSSMPTGSYNSPDDTSTPTSATSSRRSSENSATMVQRSPTSTTSNPTSVAHQPPATPPRRADSLKRNSARKSSSGEGVDHSSPSSSEPRSPTSLIGQFGSLQTTASHHHGGSNAEPKFTPSISNIGGAVLRSKTADFERILKHNKKYKSSDTGGGGGGGGGVEETVAVTSSATTSGEAPGKPERTRGSRNQQQQSSGSGSGTGLIYKRQELISSAQRSSK